MSAASTPLTPDWTTLWSDWTALVRPRSIGVIAAATVSGLGMDVAIRRGPPTLSGALLVVIASASVVVVGRPTNPQAIALALCAPLFGVWLVVRSSLWLLPLDLLAAGCLIGLSAAFARGSSVLDLSIPAASLHALRAAANALLAPVYLLGDAAKRGRRTAILRGTLLAIPLLVVVGALLASADAVFASVLRIDWGESLFHAVAFAMGAWGTAALLRLTSVDAPAQLRIKRPTLGRTEWTIVLGSLDLLLASFSAARLAAFGEGGRHVLETAGLTYARYARSGFFQLIAASVVALGAIVALRALAGPGDRRRFNALAVAGLALLMLVVVQAVQRLALYERAFGLTMPRLLATAGSIWIGIAILMLGAQISGIGATRQWYWAGIGLAGLAVILALNVINAEASVAGRNVAHAASTGKFDAAELGQLGDDAVPELAAALPKLPAAARAGVRADLCSTPAESRSDLLSYNVAREHAAAARERVCPRRIR